MLGGTRWLPSCLSPVSDWPCFAVTPGISAANMPIGISRISLV